VDYEEVIAVLKECPYTCVHCGQAFSGDKHNVYWVDVNLNGDFVRCCSYKCAYDLIRTQPQQREG